MNSVAVYYINLDHRTDRRESIEKTLTEAELPAERYPAIKNEVCGAIGCSYSHCYVLEKFLKTDKEYCIVLEDDFVFNDPDDAHFRIKQLLRCSEMWDLVMLAGNVVKTEPSKQPYLRRVVNVQTTSGYIVKRSFVPTLLKNYWEGLALQEIHMETNTTPNPAYCLDIYWKLLQPVSKWFICEPKLGYQMDSYSDIEKRVVDYKC